MLGVLELESVLMIEDCTPSIDHLPDAVATLPENGQCVPLFDVGDTIVAQRFSKFGSNTIRYLDTKILRVQRIDDDTGAVYCWNVDDSQFAVVAFNRPTLHVLKLVQQELLDADVNPLSESAVTNFYLSLVKS